MRLDELEPGTIVRLARHVRLMYNKESVPREVIVTTKEGNAVWCKTSRGTLVPLSGDLEIYHNVKVKRRRRGEKV